MNCTPEQKPINTQHPIHMGLLICMLGFFSTKNNALAESYATNNTTWVTLEELHTLIPENSLPAGASVQAKLTKHDERIHSPDCPEPLFSNPMGNRLLGRTFLKVQCIGSSTPNFFIGVDFEVWAPILVVNKIIPIGQNIGIKDVEFKTLNLAQQTQGWINDPSHLNNKIATRALTPGLVLKQEHIKGEALIRRGDTVKILIQGQGFSIGGTAQAIESAEQGQSIKIKNAQGKVLTGIAIAPSVIELTP